MQGRRTGEGHAREERGAVRGRRARPGVEVLGLGRDAREGEAALAAVVVAEQHVRVQPVPHLPAPPRPACPSARCRTEANARVFAAKHSVPGRMAAGCMASHRSLEADLVQVWLRESWL